MEFSGKETIPIRGTNYVFDLRILEPKNLTFWYENPREPLPDEFKGKRNKFSLYLDYFKKNHNVIRLISEIEFEGGVQQPIFVKEKSSGPEKGRFEVFDGNSRLAAILLLARKNEIKWSKLKCRIAPEDLTEDDLDHHINKLHGGKSPSWGWEPDSRVNNMIRLKKKGWSFKDIAAEFPGDETEKSVKESLLAHRLFSSLPEETRKRKWSICEAISKGPKFQNLEKKPAHKRLLFEAIQKPNQGGATQGQLRDYLDTFLKTPIRKLRKWIKNNELGKIAVQRSMGKASSRTTSEKRVQEDTASRSTIVTTLKKANGLLVRLHQELNKGTREKILAKVSVTEINLKLGWLKTHVKNIETRWNKLKTNKVTK